MAPGMTTAAEGSSSTSTALERISEETVRPDPGPLPVKQGEIGYVVSSQEESNANPGSEPTLPERHPADRDTPPTTAVSSPPTSASVTPVPQLTTTTKKKTPCLGKKVAGGFILSTLLTFIVQFLIFAGTIVAWVLLPHIIIKSKSSDPADPNPPSAAASNMGSSLIFLHVLFVIATLGQFLFLERRVWRLRAERYAHLHPGSIIPLSTGRRWLSDPTAIAFSPWNRPPLPTYAAALRESGGGTGDVEDGMIAVPPPPAYGNTRGSRLLLSGFMSERLRAERPESTHSGSRPMSYRSRDGDWEEIEDADRARRLEETLARLERPMSRN